MNAPALKPYKATIILDTRGYDQPVETLSDKVREGFTAAGAQVGELENLGRMDFVRVTDRNHPGDTYLTLTFEGGPEVPAQIQEQFRLDRNVKRILVETV